MKNRFKKLSALLLACITVISVLQLPTFAVADKDKAQIKVSSSTTAPEKGETFSVGVEITNYATMTPKISAMELSVSFDSSVFEFVENSIENNTLKTNAGDALAVNYNGTDSISFYYCYANDAGAYLPRADISKFTLFRFKLKVKDDLAADTKGEIKVTSCNMFDSHTTSAGNKITCKNPENLSLKAYVERPDILFNESGKNQAVYDKMVKIEFAASSAQVKYNDGESKTVTSPYYAKENGSYTISVKVDGKTITETFNVNRKIQSISMKTGTYIKEYALNEPLNLSQGEIIVQYEDVSPYSGEKGISYIPLSNEAVSITGFDNTTPGEQALIVTYQTFKTTMIVTVKNVSVYSAIVKPGSAPKYSYVPVGFPVDTTGLVITVTYSDGTQADRDVDASMLTAYLTDIEGVRSIGIRVTEDIVISNAFTVEYISAENLTAFKETVFDMDVNALTAADISTIGELQNKYNTFKTQFGPTVLADVESKYLSIVERIDELSNPNTDTTVPPPSVDSETVADTDAGDTGDVDTMKIVGYIVASIVVISVLAGAVYFIIAYVKKKREEESDEFYYYDDDDDDDDDNDSNDDFVFHDNDDEEMDFKNSNDTEEDFVSPSPTVSAFDFEKDENDDMIIGEDRDGNK